MDIELLSKFLAEKHINVSEAMRRIDSNANGILFLTNEKKQLIACITDGDIRRYLLAGGSMEGAAYEAANHTPKYAFDMPEAETLYHKKSWVAIPIVDSQMHVIDLYNGLGDLPKKKASLDIPVVINAGGKGTRLDPLTRVLPKPLIPVGDMPIIEHIIREYQSYNCNAFHIIVNYKKELLKAYFSDKRENERKYDIRWYDEDEPLGTGGGLSLLKGVINSTFFFANCDALLTANYESMLRFHRDNGNTITMICAHKIVSIPYGVIDMGKQGEILSMREKPELSFLTNTGIYIVEPEVIDDMNEGESIGFPDVIEREKQQGKKVAVFPVSQNDWMDMGQFPELEKMRMKLYGE